MGQRRLLCCICLMIAGVPAAADDWPHWRGPHRNGTTAETSGWNANEWPIRELWSTNVGEGSTSPLVVTGHVYTMGWRDGVDTVVCLAASSGKRLWSVDYPSPRYGRRATGDQGIYSGPSSTPEYDAETGLLYTLSLDGDLHCWETRAEGRKVWSKNLYEEFQVPRRPKVGRSGLRDYGYTSSPLVHGEWLIVEVGAEEGNVMAFDKRSGAVRWASQSKSPAGHNGGPVPITVEDVPCIAVHNHDGLLVVRADGDHAGETVATYDWVTSFANNIATAAVHKNFVLLTSSYNQHKIAKLEVTLRGATKVWEQEYASKVCSPVVYDGHVYWAWQRVMCLDFADGSLRWEGGRVGDPGSVIATGDGRLIVWANRGDLTLVESFRRSPDRYTELTARKNLGRSDAWPHIVLADRRLYCKDREGNVRCLSLKP